MCTVNRYRNQAKITAFAHLGQAVHLKAIADDNPHEASQLNHSARRLRAD